MRRDIEIPIVKDVHIVAIKEWNDDFLENSWYAYILNESNHILEMTIIVSRAYGKINGEERKTSTFRHVIKEINPNSLEKIELLENNVLQLNNEFMVTYFIKDKLYEKKYLFRQNCINDFSTKEVLSLNKKAVFAE